MPDTEIGALSARGRAFRSSHGSARTVLRGSSAFRFRPTPGLNCAVPAVHEQRETFVATNMAAMYAPSPGLQGTFSGTGSPLDFQLEVPASDSGQGARCEEGYSGRGGQGGSGG